MDVSQGQGGRGTDGTWALLGFGGRVQIKVPEWWDPCCPPEMAGSPAAPRGSVGGPWQWGSAGST